MVKFYIGNVRDKQSVDIAMGGVDYVFSAAALKQVPSCEFFPVEAVRTTILGTNNVLLSAIEHGVSNVVGYDEMSAGTADELSGIEVQDDTHFTIQLKKPYAPETP